MHTVTIYRGFIDWQESAEAYSWADCTPYVQVFLDNDEVMSSDPDHFYCGRHGDMGYGEWESPDELARAIAAKLAPAKVEIREVDCHWILHDYFGNMTLVEGLGPFAED